MTEIKGKGNREEGRDLGTGGRPNQIHLPLPTRGEVGKNTKVKEKGVSCGCDREVASRGYGVIERRKERRKEKGK